MNKSLQQPQCFQQTSEAAVSEEAGSLKLESKTEGQIIVKTDNKEEWAKQLQASTVKSEGWSLSLWLNFEITSHITGPGIESLGRIYPLEDTFRIDSRSTVTIAFVAHVPVVEKMSAEEEIRVSNEDDSTKMEITQEDEANRTTTGGTESLRSGSITSVDGL